MHSKRLAISGAITILCLMASAAVSLLGEGEVASHAFEGTGIGAVFTTLLALALGDAVARGWNQADGSNRMPVIKIGLLGIVWGCIRVGMGDVSMIPAITGLTWLCLQAALFVDPAEDPEQTTDEVVPAAPSPADPTGQNPGH